MGSFVPAEKARLGVVDRLFARVGASDNVARHMSTFHMEMSETANILTNATSNSFVILDEIGMYPHFQALYHSNDVFKSMGSSPEGQFGRSLPNSFIFTRQSSRVTVPRGRAATDHNFAYHTI